MKQLISLILGVAVLLGLLLAACHAGAARTPSMQKPSAPATAESAAHRSGSRTVTKATTTAAEAAFALVDRLIDEDSEIVTVLVGTDARPAETERVREHLAAQHPHVEIEVHEGGQPLYPYLIGVE